MTAGEAETSGEPTGGFGTVGQLRGLLFRYLTLAASLVGIVVLAALLAFVTVDAFGLGAAGPGWYLVFLLTLVVPVTGFVVYGVRNPGVGDVLVGTTLRLVAGTMAAVAAVVVFVVFDVQLWFLVYTLGLLPTAAVLAYRRVTRDPRLAFPVPGVVLAVGVAAGIVLKGPVDTFPTDALIYTWTVVLPVAAALGRRWARRRGRRAGAVAGVGAAGGAVAGGLALSALSGVGPAASLLLALSPGVLTVSYATGVVLGRPEDRAGLAFPAVALGGALAGAAVVRALGLARPDPWLDWSFLTSAPSRFPGEAGLYPAIIGSVFIISIVAVLSFLVGVGSAIYLEEYAPRSGAGGRVTRFIQVNIANLAGVPSVVYGLLGLGVFVNLVGLGFGTVLVAGLTLSLLILPIVIISAREAIRSVPDSLRQASYGMGATRWQTVRNVVLPEAMPGILTGTILALGRAIGETAPLIIIGLATTKFTPPSGLLDKTTAMPTQVFGWAFLPDEAFRSGVLAAGVVTLMAVLLTINSVAIYLRNKYETGT